MMGVVFARGANRLVFIALIGACVGSGPSGGGGPPDAPHGTLHLDARPGDGSIAADAAPFTCRDRKTTGLDSGHHNPGTDCQGSCHDHGFAMSGTLYSSAAGGATVSGVSLTVMDASGQVFDMVTSQNGNFWWPLTVVFPAQVIASSCPTVTPMNTPLQFGQGACSTGACHAGPAGRVHL